MTGRAGCEFFLKGICEQAAENEGRARAILALHERVKNQVVDLTHSQHAIRAVDFLFQTPVFPAPHFIEGASIPKPTASRILVILRDAGLLVALQEGKGRRPGIYAFRELVNIAEGKKLY